MQFEGEHNVIPLRGIGRAGAEKIATAGSLGECVGLTEREGSYVPFALTTVKDFVFPRGKNTVKTFIHHINQESHRFCITLDNGVYSLYLLLSEGEWKYIVELLSAEVAIYGNVIYTTDSSLCVIYNQETKEYRVHNNLYRRDLDYTRCELVMKDIVSGVTGNYGYDDPTLISDETKYIKLRGRLNNAGYICEPHYWCYVVVFKDGTKYVSPKYMYEFQNYLKTDWDNFQGTHIALNAIYKNANDDDGVSRVDVYLSDTWEYRYTYRAYDNDMIKTTDEQIDEIGRRKDIQTHSDVFHRSMNFYRVASFDYNSLKVGDNDIDLVGKLDSDLLLQSQLEEDNNTIYRGENNYVYNGRLHLLNCTVYKKYNYTYRDLFGDRLSSANYSESNPAAYNKVLWDIIVWYKYNNTVYATHTSGQEDAPTGKYWGYANGSYLIDNYVVLNDKSIQCVQVRAKLYKGDNILKFAIENNYFTSSENYDYSTVFRTLRMSTSDFCHFENYVYDIDTGMITDSKTGEDIGYEWTESLLVSRVNYLQGSFENYSLNFNREKLVNVTSFSQQLSDYHFGTYPLLVFSEGGIYVMELNKEGTYAYESVSQRLSRNRLLSKDLLLPFREKILYATKLGFYYITNSGVSVQVYESIFGDNVDVDSEDLGSGVKVYRKALQHSRLGQLSRYVDNSDIRERLSEYRLYYSTDLDRIVLYSQADNYFYLISDSQDIVLATKMTDKIIFIDNDDNIFTEAALSVTPISGIPYIYAMKRLEYFYNGASKCLIQTRAIKLLPPFSSVFRVVLRGYFNRGTSWIYNNDVVGLYVFGSLDSKHWQLIGYKEKSLSDGGFNDIGCTVYRATQKYIMLVCVGRLDSTSYINHIELTAMNKYNNKLK